DASDLLRVLLNGGHSAKAGYLAGAFRQTGRPDLAGEIISAMKSAGYDVRESNPFEAGQIFGTRRRPRAPIVGRVEMLWERMRGAVAEAFPKATPTILCPLRDIRSRRKRLRGCGKGTGTRNITKMTGRAATRWRRADTGKRSSS